MLPFPIISNLNVVPYVPNGQQTFTAASTNFTVPAEVILISALCIGGGSNNVSSSVGGAGGDLRWANNIPVTPGEILVVTVGQVSATTAGAAGNSTKIVRQSTGEVLLIAKGGRSTDVSTTIGNNVGGGNGGVGTSYGGGSAGGYSGNGQGTTGSAGPTGSGAGGAGGSYTFNSNRFGGGGGGTGIMGIGTEGAGGPIGATAAGFAPGYAGSANITGHGTSRGSGPQPGTPGGAVGAGGNYGGARGAARIIFGTGRAYPGTLTTDITT